MQGSTLISLTCTFHYQLEFIVSTWVNQSTWHGEKKQTEKYRHCFFKKRKVSSLFEDEAYCLYYCISQSFRYPWECWTVNFWTLCKPPVACSLYIYRRRALHYSSSKGGRNQDAGLVRAHCCAVRSPWSNRVETGPNPIQGEHPSLKAPSFSLSPEPSRAHDSAVPKDRIRRPCRFCARFFFLIPSGSCPKNSSFFTGVHSSAPSWSSPKCWNWKGNSSYSTTSCAFI